MGGLIPALIKHQFKNEPVFADSKIIYSISKNINKEKLSDGFADMIADSTQLKPSVIAPFKGGGNDDCYKGGAKNADVVYFSHAEVSSALTKSIKSSKSKKVLKFNPEEEDLTSIIELYAELAPNEEEE
jgi:starch synthase